MDWRDYIVSDPQILLGKPTLKGTRISVELLLDLFSGGWSLTDVLESYPHINEEQIRAAFAYAAEMVRQDTSEPLAASATHS